MKKATPEAIRIEEQRKKEYNESQRNKRNNSVAKATEKPKDKKSTTSEPSTKKAKTVDGKSGAVRINI